MYEEFYHLSGKPFQLNPDPKFFYRSKGHQRAMAYLRYGLAQAQGFIVVTGDVGTGKSMLVSNLFEELPEDGFAASRIVSTNIRDVDLLRMVAAECGLKFEKLSKAALLNQIKTYFAACIDEGRRPLLVVDEAQNLPRSAIEELRMLSNFEHNGQPLVQSFLLGQREFRSTMRSPGLEQLRQRVIAAYHLKPLSDIETASYIKHRLKRVGWDKDPEITDDVYDAIYRYTKGVPRRINTLMDRILLHGFLEELHRIDLDALSVVLDEMDSESGAESEAVPDAAEALPAETAPAPAAVAQPQISNVDISQLQHKLAALEQMMGRISLQLENVQAQAGPGAGVRGAVETGKPKKLLIGGIVLGVVSLVVAIALFLNGGPVDQALN
ncbi:MAG: XrtA-associated ATPase [Gammaproteobacteria bacterium]|nr:XrtA-associated ATPase [Gammaproteobacteria bacterium]